jgi:glycogen debranching enzyme
VTPRTVTILDGNSFLASDERGDVDASPQEPTGLFAYDTRFLSTWVLTVDGGRLRGLAVEEPQYFEARFLLAASGTASVDPSLSVLRRRVVGNGLHEEVTVQNDGVEPVRVELRLTAASDFRDLFEVRDGLEKKGHASADASNGCLVLRYERGTLLRATTICASAPARVDPEGLTFDVVVEPHATWTTDVEVVVEMTGLPRRQLRPKHVRGVTKPRPNMTVSLQQWIRDAPRLRCDWNPLHTTYQRSLVDLAALRFSPLAKVGHSVPASGPPWFMAMFGRDSIIASLQALPFAPELAASTLRALAARQGTRFDDFRDEQPGRIMHEARFGELTAFEERPQSPYYGSADATPLFVILLDEYERWTGDRAFVHELEHPARAAIGWLDGHADLMGNGYVAFQTRNPTTGLENQCWKDSPDSISDRDGRLPPFPRATCELQGYAYAARVRAARLARDIWRDHAYAARLERDAAALKRAFNRDWWLADKRHFALALDGDGKLVDALASNIGHLFFTGIVDRSKARALVDHLMGPRLFSGWGVRTLALGEARYNPLGYHVGAVWPFDNSIIAWGMRTYGFRLEAARIAAAILEAASLFGGRLPDAFAGYDRADTGAPVRYPNACVPRAWSAGAPLLLLRAMLGLEPIREHLIVDAALPAGMGHLELLDIPGRWGHVDAFARGRIPADLGEGVMAGGEALGGQRGRPRRLTASGTR